MQLFRRMRRALPFLLAGGLFAIISTPARAAPDPNICLYQKSEPNERERLIALADIVVNGQRSDVPAAMDALDKAAKEIADACVASEGWPADARNAATAQLRFDAIRWHLEALVIAEGMSIEKLAAAATTFSDADLAVMQAANTPSVPDDVRRMAQVIERSGVQLTRPGQTELAIAYLHQLGQRNMAYQELVKRTTPVAASTDPRQCLLQQASQTDQQALLNAVSLWIDKAPGQTGHTIDNVAMAQADRCIKSQNWSRAYRDSARSLASSEAFVRVLGERLRQQGVDPTPIDTFVQHLPYKRLGSFEWLYERDSTFPRNWNEATSGLVRQPANAQQKAMLVEYINQLAKAEKSLRNFGELNTPVSQQLLVEAWQVLPAIHASSPTFAERALTNAERSEAAKLARGYRDVNSGQSTMPTLQRLLQLGASGDRQAMIAARDALAWGPPWELNKYYLDMNVDTTPLRSFTSALAAVWTAHVWQRHGYEEAGRKVISHCVDGMYGDVWEKEKEGVLAKLRDDGVVIFNSSYGDTADDAGTSAESCGFVLLGKPAYVEDGKNSTKLRSIAPAGVTVQKTYYNSGGSPAFRRTASADFYIAGVRFSPILGDRAFLEQKFLTHMQLRRDGLLANPKGGRRSPTASLALAMPWYERYAVETGRLGELEAADVRSDQKVQAKLAEDESRRVSEWRSALAAFNADGGTEESSRRLMYAASALGGSYWKEFERLTYKSPTTLAANISNGAYSGGSGFGSQQVQVRTYDSNGNYTGSTTTSAVWADIMKMTSGPPR